MNLWQHPLRLYVNFLKLRPTSLKADVTNNRKKHDELGPVHTEHDIVRSLSSAKSKSSLFILPHGRRSSNLRFKRWWHVPVANISHPADRLLYRKHKSSVNIFAVPSYMPRTRTVSLDVLHICAQLEAVS